MGGGEPRALFFCYFCGRFHPSRSVTEIHHSVEHEKALRHTAAPGGPAAGSAERDRADHIRGRRARQCRLGATLLRRPALLLRTLQGQLLHLRLSDRIPPHTRQLRRQIPGVGGAEADPRDPPVRHVSLPILHAEGLLERPRELHADDRPELQPGHRPGKANTASSGSR